MVIVMLQTAEYAVQIFDKLTSEGEEGQFFYKFIADYQAGEIKTTDKSKYSIIEQ